MDLSKENLEAEVFLRRDAKGKITKVVKDPQESFKGILLFELARLESQAIQGKPLEKDDIAALRVIQDNLELLEPKKTIRKSKKPAVVDLVAHISGK